MVYYQLGSNGYSSEVAIIASMNRWDSEKRLDMIREVYGVDLTQDVDEFRLDPMNYINTH